MLTQKLMLADLRTVDADSRRREAAGILTLVDADSEVDVLKDLTQFVDADRSAADADSDARR